MTALAQELDRRLQALDPRKAARAERLVRKVLALVEEEEPVPSSRRAYILRTHSFGLQPGIDPTKLGQLADEL